MSSTASLRFADDSGREISVQVGSDGIRIPGGRGGVKIDFPFDVSRDASRVSRPMRSFRAGDGIIILIEGMLLHNKKNGNDNQIRIRIKRNGRWFPPEKTPQLRIFVAEEENGNGEAPAETFLKVGVSGGDLASEVIVVSVPLAEVSIPPSKISVKT